MLEKENKETEKSQRIKMVTIRQLWMTREEGEINSELALASS